MNVQFKTITSHLYHHQRTVVQGKLVARNIRPRVKNVRLADGGVSDAVPKRPHADADVRLNQPMYGYGLESVTLKKLKLLNRESPMQPTTTT